MIKYNQAANLNIETSFFLAVPDPEEVERSYGEDGAKIGKELNLEIRFHSQPAPTLEDFEWYPYDLSDPISNTTTIGRYTAENITAVIVHPFLNQPLLKNIIIRISATIDS